MRTRLPATLGALLLCLSMMAHATDPIAAPASTEVQVSGLQGHLLRHADFPSRVVQPRNIDVWLPPGYRQDKSRHYPVLYMHDGQNLFGVSPSPGGTDWGIDEAMVRLVQAGQARPAIVVAIWNTPARLAEYMPRAPLRDAPVEFLAGYPTLPPSQIVSDAYLEFIVGELKPFIDREYRTLTHRDDTFVMGSSMGGLISLYALARYPEAFGGAAAVSTHWPAGDGITIDWFGRMLPPAGHHRLYFDFGTETLDAAYEPFQRDMDRALPALGYRDGVDWTTLKFQGHAHSEASWHERADHPLRFLLDLRAGD